MVEMDSRGEIVARRVLDSGPRLDRPADPAAQRHAGDGRSCITASRRIGPLEGEMPGRANGVLVSMVAGKAVAFGLDGLQERAEMFVAPGEEVYEGMIVGENSRTGDMAVNPTKEKKLTNMRASGSDRNIILKPPRVLTLEEALEYIEEDELVEVTPSIVRLRKVLLLETDRRRAARQRA